MADGAAHADRGVGAGPVYLHVGLPKTGTTFLQRLLRDNRELLAEHGVLYPVHGPASMFHAAIELRRSHEYWGVDPERIEGTWQGMCEEARAFCGSTIMGHEILAAATKPQIKRVAADLSDVELHVVVTARDLGRQIPAWWQEWVKDRHVTGFAETMERQVLPGWDADTRKSLFWRSQDLVGVLRRWGTAVPPDRIHVVTAPPPGADPQELWRRFSAAVGVPDGIAVDPGPRSNESLGVAEVALLRATIEALEGRLVQPDYGPVVKHWFAEQVLSPRASRRPELPADWQLRVDQMTDRWTSYLTEAGVRVHGSLDDLRSTVAGAGVPAPDDVAAEELTALAPRAMAEMLIEVAQLRQEGQEARRELALAERTLDDRRVVRRGRRVLGAVKRRALERVGRSR